MDDAEGLEAVGRVDADGPADAGLVDAEGPEGIGRANVDGSRGARLAAEAWEALFRAQVVLAREFADEDVWGGLTRGDYDVLYTLSKAPAGLRMTEINDRIMLTQPGVSRLIARLEQRGFVERRPDPDDARAQRIALTAAGREIQQAVGRRHVRQIARAMNRALDSDQLRQLHELCSALIAGAARSRMEGHGGTANAVTRGAVADGAGSADGKELT